MDKPVNIAMIAPPEFSGRTYALRLLSENFRVHMLFSSQPSPKLYDLQKTFSGRLKIFSLNDFTITDEKLVGQFLDEAAVVLNFLSSDLLNIKTSGEMQGWALEIKASHYDRTLVQDLVIKHWPGHSNIIWMNLLHGNTAHTGQHHYCPARYAINGIEQALAMLPHFSKTTVVSLCLTNHKHSNAGHDLAHCGLCIAESHKLTQSIRKDDLQIIDRLLRILLS